MVEDKRRLKGVCEQSITYIELTKNKLVIQNKDFQYKHFQRFSIE